MKNIHLKTTIIAALMVYIIAIIAFVSSYLFPVMDDPDLQANFVLSLIIIPAALIGAYIYYRNGHQTNGFILGVSMFMIAIIMDALVTVPFFIIPYGGNYVSFFTDPGFWLIGLEYISVVTVYSHIKKDTIRMKFNSTLKK